MKFTIALLLVTVVFVPAMNAQDSTQVSEDSAGMSATHLYRSPQKARVLSVIPGWGYLYTGEYLRGYLTWVGTIGGILMGTAVFILDPCALAALSWSECKNPPPQWIHQALGIITIGSGVWTWVSSIRDAPHAAERANTRHDRKKLKITPVIAPSFDSRSELRAGLSVSW